MTGRLRATAWFRCESFPGSAAVTVACPRTAMCGGNGDPRRCASPGNAAVTEYKRVILLVLVMAVVVTAVTAVAIGILYGTAFERERLHLISTAQEQTALIAAVAQFDRTYHSDFPGGPQAATIGQIVAAHEARPSLGGTTEITLGRLQRQQIVFLMRHRHAESGPPPPVRIDSGLAEPMRRALAGESGTMVGIDYHGERVLAAHEPVPILGLGVVAKVDLAEIRAPFMRAGLLVAALSALFIALGTILFVRLTNPMIAALSAREQKLALILASTGEGIFGMDTDGRCTFANKSALRMLGYRDEQALLSRDMHELMHHSEVDGTPRSREHCAVHQALHDNKSVFKDDETLWRADGSSFFAEYRAYPMRKGGTVVGAVVAFVDITQRKERDQQLVQAQKMEVLGQLTGGIAHDFNNLLTIILGNLRLLRDDGAEADEKARRECMEDAISAAEDGADLTRRLLAFSRKKTLMAEWSDVNEFIRESRGFLQRVLGEDINLELLLSEGSLPIRTDRQQLHSAILNLAINASDAMPTGGVLSIETGRIDFADRWPRADIYPPDVAPGSYVAIKVTDSGTGMPEEVMRRAVEPFFTTKKPGQGSGLGLSMVYEFANQSGGALGLRSALRQGTEVSLFLPEAKQPAVPGSPELPDRQEQTGKIGATVLVAEDETRLRRYACRSLAALGYNVLESGNAAEARRWLEDPRHIDVLFSDIVMPGDMNGTALARWAVRHRPDLKVLLTTGYSEEVRREREIEAAGFPVIEKPYSKDQLGAAINGLFAAAQK